MLTALIFFFLKCFLHTYRVITFIQISRVFFDNSSVSAGILKIPTPLCFRLVAQPYMEQFAPGIAKKSPKYVDFMFHSAKFVCRKSSRKLLECTFVPT